MSPTAVITYLDENDDDDFSISTCQIQTSQPTSFCDNVANLFYINFMQPLEDLLPERMVEHAFELDRRLVISDDDLSTMTWERKSRRKGLEQKMAKEKRLRVQMQQQQAKSRDGAGDDKTCSVSKVQSHVAITSNIKLKAAIKRVFFHTVKRRFANNKMVAKKMCSFPSKLSVSKKGYNRKPRFFRRKGRSKDSIADDLTLCSSNPPSESSLTKTIETEIAVRKFSAKNKRQEDGSIASDESDSSGSNDESSFDDSVEQNSRNKAPVCCITVDPNERLEPKPFVAVTRKPYGPARFKVDETVRTVYDEREVDKIVARLIPITPPTNPIIKKENAKAEDEKLFDGDDESVPKSTNSLDMKVLMNSISQKYSLSTYANQRCEKDNHALVASLKYTSSNDDNESMLTDGKLPKNDNGLLEQESLLPARERMRENIDLPLPSVIFLPKKTQKSVGHNPVSLALIDGRQNGKKNSHLMTCSLDVPSISSKTNTLEDIIGVGQQQIAKVSPDETSVMSARSDHYLNHMSIKSTSDSNRSVSAQGSVNNEPNNIYQRGGSVRVTWTDNLPTARDKVNHENCYKYHMAQKFQFKDTVNSNTQSTNDVKDSSGSNKLSRLRMTRTAHINAPHANKRPEDGIQKSTFSTKSTNVPKDKIGSTWHDPFNQHEFTRGNPVEKVTVDQYYKTSRGQQHVNELKSHNLSNDERKQTDRLARKLRKQRLHQVSREYKSRSSVDISVPATVHSSLSDTQSRQPLEQAVQKDALNKPSGSFLGQARRVQNFEKIFIQVKNTEHS